MPTTPADRLAALAAASMAQATATLAAGGSAGAWERAMAQAIARAQTAAYIAATAQRLGVSPDSALISERRLSRAERNDIKAAVAAQMAYFERFAADVRAGRLSPAQTMARAMLYAGAVRAPYYAARWGEWEIPADLIPGNQACLGNCRCHLSDVRDHGDGTGTLTRTLGGERHCDECPPLAGDHVVRRKRAA
jgi:hypothetical protein